VGAREDLLDGVLELEGLNWIDVEEPGAGSAWEVEVQVRHAAPPTRARLIALGHGRARVDLEQPVFAAAPGQAAVAWVGEAVLCGGTIAATAPPVPGA
jgi:tRNA-specific 2-thiouridylase